MKIKKGTYMRLEVGDKLKILLNEFYIDYVSHLTHRIVCMTVSNKVASIMATGTSNIHYYPEYVFSLRRTHLSINSNFENTIMREIGNGI